MAEKLMDITYRKLLREDAADYWSLRLEAVKSQPLAFGPTPEEHCQTTVESAASLIQTPQTFIVGAFEGTTLVGMARFMREPFRKERHKAYVRAVYVTGSHRKRGVARALISAIIAEAASDSTLEQLLLAVGTHNTGARALYTSLGFVSFGIEPHAMKVGPKYIDEEHMVLFLRC